MNTFLALVLSLYFSISISIFIMGSIFSVALVNNSELYDRNVGIVPVIFNFCVVIKRGEIKISLLKSIFNSIFWVKFVIDYVIKYTTL